jgi:hypothetical protein
MSNTFDFQQILKREEMIFESNTALVYGFNICKLFGRSTIVKMSEPAQTQRNEATERNEHQSDAHPKVIHDVNGMLFQSSTSSSSVDVAAVRKFQSFSPYAFCDD